MRLSFRARQLSPEQKPLVEVYDDRHAAAYAIRAALTFNVWVHRRSETISFPDPETTRRQMTVDFTMPEGDALTKGSTVFLPLHILRKVNLRNFDLSNGEGISLPTLTSKQHGKVVCLGLETMLARDWPKSGDELRRIVERIVLGKPPLEGEAEDPIRFALEQTQDGGDLAVAFKGPYGSSWGFLAGLIRELSKGFMLLVPLPYEPDRRQLVKFAHDAAKDSLHADVPFSNRAYRSLSRALSSVGVMARQEELADLQVGWTSSYHVEVIPPEEMWVAEASLEIPRHPPDLSTYRYRPHCHASGKERQEVGELTLLLNPRRESLVLPLFGSAAAIAGALAFVPTHLQGLDPQVLGALLLLPFALIAYYVRGAEHRYVSTAMRGVRILAGFPVVAAVMVLGMLALGLLDAESKPGDFAYELAGWSARGAAAATIFLLPSLVFPGIANALRPGIRRAQEKTRRWPPRVRKGLRAVFLLLVISLGIGALVAVGWGAYSSLPIESNGT